MQSKFGIENWIDFQSMVVGWNEWKMMGNVESMKIIIQKGAKWRLREEEKKKMRIRGTNGKLCAERWRPIFALIFCWPSWKRTSPDGGQTWPLQYISLAGYAFTALKWSSAGRFLFQHRYSCRRPFPHLDFIEIFHGNA